MTYVVKVFYNHRWHVVHMGHNFERAKIMAHKPYNTRHASSVRIIEIKETIVYDYKFAKRIKK